MHVAPIRAESGRYATSLLLLPELWAGPGAWDRMTGFLGHRGWEGGAADLRPLRGGIRMRSDAVAAYVRRLAAPPVLLAHGAGGLVALGAARSVPTAALVLLAPLLPGSPGARGLVHRWDAMLPLLLGRDVPPPAGAAAVRAFDDPPAWLAAGFAPESADAVLDVARGRVAPAVPSGVPTLLVSGAADPLLPGPAAAAFAAAIAAEHRTVADVGHWLVGTGAWQALVTLIHRWLVRQLGESLLEFYPEAMAERDDEE